MASKKEEVTTQTVAEEVQAPKEFNIGINISDKNLAYKSDFNEAETIFWLEAVKNLIIQKTFAAAGMQDNS